MVCLKYTIKYILCTHCTVLPLSLPIHSLHCTVPLSLPYTHCTVLPLSPSHTLTALSLSLPIHSLYCTVPLSPHTLTALYCPSLSPYTHCTVLPLSPSHTLTALSLSLPIHSLYCTVPLSPHTLTALYCPSLSPYTHCTALSLSPSHTLTALYCPSLSPYTHCTALSLSLSIHSLFCAVLLLSEILCSTFNVSLLPFQLGSQLFKLLYAQQHTCICTYICRLLLPLQTTTSMHIHETL